MLISCAVPKKVLSPAAQDGTFKYEIITLIKESFIALLCHFAAQIEHKT